MKTFIYTVSNKTEKMEDEGDESSVVELSGEKYQYKDIQGEWSDCSYETYLSISNSDKAHLCRIKPTIEITEEKYSNTDNKAMLKWLKYCVSIGWDQKDVPALQEMWMKFKSTSNSVPEPIKDISKEKGVCRMCKNETEFADESLCDACWDEEILKDAKEAQIKERKQEWDWLGWLQARIPELKKSQNVFWLKQCVNDLLSQSQPYKELSEGDKTL